MTERFVSAVRVALGEAAVDSSDATLAAYGFNRLPGGDCRPAAVVFPAETDEVRVLVELAGEHGVVLWPTSAGQNQGLGEYSPVRAGQVVIDLGRRMRRIVEVDDVLGYAVIEPGVTFEQLRGELAARGDTLMMSTTSGPPHGSVLGNALDRGAGYTPYFDHFGMLCGLEVVLADGTVLRTGDGALAGANTRWINKSGFGPLLDGLFSQSNLGIVTRAAIWLMPRPPVIRAFGFTFPDDGDLAQIIDLVRPLKQTNVVPTLIKVTSGLYGLATEMSYPFARTGGVRPLPDDVRHELEHEHGTGAWTVTGACYGPTLDAVQPVIDRVRGHFGRSAHASYLPPERFIDSPMFGIHLATFSGDPTTRELNLLNWLPGGGATWFLPATPMIGKVAQRQHDLSRRILAEHGFDYIVEFVCGPRAARGLHLIIFDRSDEAERARARSCYQALVDSYDQAGYPIGRAPTDWQQRAITRLPELQEVCGAIKHALDPGGVIAPGKYGIG